MVEKIDFKTLTNSESGDLTFFEVLNDIPFQIKRFYYVYNVPEGVRRGNHAHKKLAQVLIAINGRIRIHLDNGINNEYVILDNPKEGLIVRPGIWHTIDFISNNAILCVAAEEYYDESDYIRNYEEFKTYVDSGYWLI